jgi:hypothetical protein
MKSKYVVSLFAASMFLLSGCDDQSDLDNYTLCYDIDIDSYCDDTGERIDPNSYLIINGKQEAYVTYDSYSSSSSGG